MKGQATMNLQFNIEKYTALLSVAEEGVFAQFANLDCLWR